MVGYTGAVPHLVDTKVFAGISAVTLVRKFFEPVLTVALLLLRDIVVLVAPTVPVATL